MLFKDKSSGSDLRAIAQGIGILVLRVGLGAVMAFGHGWGKLSNFSEYSAQFPDPLGVGSQLSLSLAVFAEFFCSIALIFGFATRVVTLPLMITMLVAFGIVHADDPWMRKEPAFVYFLGFLSLWLTGAGPISLDRVLSRKFPKLYWKKM